MEMEQAMGLGRPRLILSVKLLYLRQPFFGHQISGLGCYCSMQSSLTSLLPRGAVLPLCKMAVGGKRQDFALCSEQVTCIAGFSCLAIGQLYFIVLLFLHFWDLFTQAASMHVPL